MKPSQMNASMLAASLLLSCATAIAQSYPVKPVRILVPFPPGGGVDTVARTFSQKFTEAWGQPVLVENRPGAGGNIAADVIAKSPADGYSLLITTTGHAIAPSLYKKLPFDALKDFAPAVQLTSTYLVLVANPALPGTLKEIVALARTQPGKLNYAHTGLGVAPHIVGEMLKASAGIDLFMVAYKGDAQTVPAMLSNEAQLGFSPPTTVVNLVRSGKLRAIAVSGVRRGAAFPDVPNVSEAGFPGATYNGWVGLFGPAGTPREALNRIATEANNALKTPDLVKALPIWGADGAGGTPEEFARKYLDEVAFYAKIIKLANIPQVD